jgi:hypothetical protein
VLAEKTKRSASEILGIVDKYLAYCIDETACYVYAKHLERIRNQQELEKSMKKYSRRKK